MANRNGASLHCVAMRVAALQSSGAVTSGSAMYVTDNLVKIDFNAEVETGPEVADRNAAGSIYVSYKLQDIVKRLTMVVEPVNNDPELEAILTGGTTYTSGGSGTSAVQGYQYPGMFVPSVPNGVSIEAWTHNIVGGKIDATYPYQRWAFPRVFLRKANRTIDINRMPSTFEGFGIENDQWSTGPTADWAFDSTKVAQWCYATTFPASAVGTQLTTA